MWRCGRKAEQLPNPPAELARGAWRTYPEQNRVPTLPLLAFGNNLALGNFKLLRGKCAGESIVICRRNLGKFWWWMAAGDVGRGGVLVVAVSLRCVWRWGVGSAIEGLSKDLQSCACRTSRCWWKPLCVWSWFVSMNLQHLLRASEHFSWKHSELSSCPDWARLNQIAHKIFSLFFLFLFFSTVNSGEAFVCASVY